MTEKGKSAEKRSSRTAGRRERLAAELRANLLKRKRKARGGHETVPDADMKQPG